MCPRLAGVIFVLLACVQMSAGESIRSETCLYKWLRQAGLSHNKSELYDNSLRSAAITEKQLKSELFPAITLSALMHGDMQSAEALKNCISGQHGRCQSFNPCQRGGQCVFSFSRRINVCTCRKGLYGDLCEKDCNECSGGKERRCKSLHHNCHDNATCMNTVGSFRCSCKKGYKGDGVSCIDDLECRRKPCSRRANCKNTFGSYVCTCKAGYQGNGHVCENVIECQSSPCLNGGTCRDHINRYTCHCAVGYEGTRCEKRWLTDFHKPLPDALRNVTKVVQDLAEKVHKMGNSITKLEKDHCKQTPCKNGGRCIPQLNSYFCLCRFGFYGANCAKGLKGRRRSHPADSCKEILAGDLQAPSGMYWIKPRKKPRGRAPKKVYCDMTAGGWMRVVNFDAKSNGCPATFHTVNRPVKMCAVKRRGCTSMKFTTLGVPYTEVRGYIYGHQYYHTIAFAYGGRGINDNYLDGVSITYGSPRKHIWTFAAGFSSKASSRAYNCPCAMNPGSNPPAFVGNDYFCDSGNPGYRKRVWYPQRLWDGQCLPQSKCCNRRGMPYFLKKLNARTTEKLEVRICITDGVDDENIGVEKMELFTH